jgi:hypothetical protein
MAHFAKLDKTNTVVQVVCINNKEIQDSNGIEYEYLGIQFCKSLFGKDTNWVQTSYNSSFRKNYADIGYAYDSLNDVFIAPKPFNSWVLDTNEFKWQSPIPYPNDGSKYIWDESIIAWIKT